jgi:hypothetical protein
VARELSSLMGQLRKRKKKKSRKGPGRQNKKTSGVFLSFFFSYFFK